VRKTAPFLTITLIILLLAGCSEERLTIDVQPNARFLAFKQATASDAIIIPNTFFEIEYRWKVGAEFTPPERDLTAFVHFVDEDGNIILDENGNTVQDDHKPPVPFANWKPGDEITYLRRNPNFPAVLAESGKDIKMYIGLYDPKTMTRAEMEPIAPEKMVNKAHLIKTFRITNRVFMEPVFDESWYSPEPNAQRINRWTKKVSTVQFKRFRNATGAVLYISGDSAVELLPEGVEMQQLRIYMNSPKPEYLITEQPITFYKSTSLTDAEAEPPYKIRGNRLNRIRVPIPQALYEIEIDEPIKLVIEVDTALNPGGVDDREELGFLVDELLLVPVVDE